MTELELATERTLAMIAEQDKARAERHAALMACFDRLEAAFDAILKPKSQDFCDAAGEP